MKNIIVYCELTDENNISEVSLEILSKGRKLADRLGCRLEAIVAGYALDGIENQLSPYGVDIIHIADDKRLSPFRSLPHAAIAIHVFKEVDPSIGLFGSTSVGRDIAPRIGSALNCGLTADCTMLDIGDYTDKKSGKLYKDLLYAIRPAFGGNILATIINPDMHPQLATIREGVMKKEIYDANHRAEITKIDTSNILNDRHFVMEVIERQIEKSKVNIKDAPIIVAGGYGVGSKDNFDKLYELAELLGGDVAGSRAAVDAGYIEHDRQVGQTGVTVRPKLYIACGISGAIQHRAGMDESAMIISVNTDPNAPINDIADYVIIGDLNETLPKMIKYYRKNAK